MFSSISEARRICGSGDSFTDDKILQYLVYKSGADTPSNTSTVPDFIGQYYLDTANNKWYKAKATSAASDFLILN